MDSEIRFFIKIAAKVNGMFIIPSSFFGPAITELREKKTASLNINGMIYECTIRQWGDSYLFGDKERKITSGYNLGEGDVVFFHYLGDSYFKCCVCCGKTYQEKFFERHQRWIYNFYVEAGLSYKRTLILPEIFSEYPIRKGRPFATIYTRLGVWKIKVVPFNSYLWRLDGRCWESFSDAHQVDAKCLIMFEYCGGLKFQVRIYQRDGCEPPFMRNSPILVYNEEDAYNCECTPARPAPSSSYKPKEPEIIYVADDDDDDDDDGNNDNPGSVELTFVTSWKLTLTENNIHSHSSAPKVYIPAEKTRRYNLRKFKTARLKFPQHSQQIWDVQLHKLKDTVRKTPRITFNEGWKEFAIANNLRVGESVEFQIFKPNDQLNGPNEVIQIDVLYI